MPPAEVLKSDSKKCLGIIKQDFSGGFSNDLNPNFVEFNRKL